MSDETPTKQEPPRDWAEIGRAFYLSDADMDFEAQSPHGLHDPDTGELVTAAEIVEGGGKLLSHFKDKLSVPVPHVILQDQADPEERDIKHVELTEAEYDRLKEAYDAGRLDPDGNGTNRLLSTLSLTDLGLGRIEKMLGKGRKSGASEAIV